MTWLGRWRLELWADLIRGDDSVAFEHCVELVGRQAADVIDGSGWPANFDAVDFCGRAEPKVQAQIVLREIASAAMNFAGLRHSSGNNFDTSIEGEAVAFGSSELETDPMASRNPMIFQ